MNLSGNPFDYLLAFAGGVLVSFSPCTYPLIPVSLSYIGVTSASTRLKGLFLSLIYVTGLALTYSLLGLIAAFSGSIFGIVSLHPLSRIIVGVIFIFFGISLLGFLPLKTIVLSAGFKDRKKTIGNTFLLGISSALVISPCVSPVLGSILIFVATKKNIFYGASLLLVFAYGVGFIFILAGTFSAILLSLPKSGLWMSYIKKVAAVVLMGMGLYFLIVGLRAL